jgi:Endonuclease I.
VSGYSGTVFEPIDEYKGDIARGFFYMSVRYYGEDSQWGFSDMTNKSEIRPWALTMLLDWSDKDPVDV